MRRAISWRLWGRSMSRRREVGRSWDEGHGDRRGKENFEVRIAGWELHLEGLVSMCIARGLCDRFVS